jgi:hypothetical protein
LVGIEVGITSSADLNLHPGKEKAMLWDASALDGYAIEASDGRIGHVSDFLFEDNHWVIRWLVVDTGNWLSDRKVLLPVSALGTPDPALRQFPIKLTKQQVIDSPDIDTDSPVSRHHETHIYRHYGWDPYWGSTFFPMGGGMAMPDIETLPRSGSLPLRANGDVFQQGDGDPHLRSAAAVTGFRVHATDGEIGHIIDFLVDDADWSIRYIKVDTKKWWPGIIVLMPPPSVRKIGRPNRTVHLDVDRREVLNSPSYDASKTVDGAYDGSFLTYYGIRWVEA